ncbi:adenylate/guanylate cyclase domain-containing protein [Lutimonas halocynthiae]|uniref:adenylate/guanylate cyclase domain-containing protein n=1 Tax=Lutimonas halocynthiae TaxID=1446477 RepID=UPI0025B4A698|nr:adenylate/guanylate cyclase domain-containing protein [Lutimonas halocynthiae]MDN3641677.1 adenylate/guanylate cyclase domain-containing protein [Lutimonas halocynthiae]
MIINHKVSFAAVCLFLLACLPGFSQNVKIDSLKGIVETGAKDTAMVNTLNDLSVLLRRNQDEEEAIETASKALELATSLNFKKGMGYALKNSGLVYYNRGDYLEALDDWTKSLEIFESVPDTLGMANIINNLGTLYFQAGSLPKALDNYLRSLGFAEKAKDTFQMTTVLYGIGAIYGELREYDKSLEYFNQMGRYTENLNNNQLRTYYLMGLGEVYMKKGDYEMSLKYYKEALPLNDDTPEYTHNLTMLGTVEQKIGDIDKSIEYLNLAYESAKENKQQWETVQTLIPLGKLYQDSDFSKAINIYKEAESVSKQMETDKSLVDIYKGMSETYAIHGHFDKAYQYQELYEAEKDSLFNLETDDKIRGLQFDFDLSKKEDEIGLLEKEAEIQEFKERRQKNMLFATGIALFLIVLLAISLYRRYKFTRETNLIIEKEKDRSEKLLLNILPEETAQELKEFGKVKAKRFDSVTVLFTDFVGFTAYAQNLEPEELVSSVDYYFSKFDEIMEKYDVEKIKTIGDAYMCVSGLPEPGENDVFRAVQAAFEIVEFIEASKKTKMTDLTQFDIRIGINTGPIVAGVVGTKKFAYDIWGDTVNVASRMESKSKPGKINISESTYELIKDQYDCEFRGEIDVKNKGMMKMFFVNTKKTDHLS